MKYFFTILLFITGFVHGYSQNPVCRNINNLNGLPSNTIYDIVQDEKGFIWVAHNKGLSKYDGTSFKPIKNSASKGRALTNILIENDKVWCQDFSGNFYYTQHDSLIKQSHIQSGGIYINGVINEHKILHTNLNNAFSYDINTQSDKKITIGNDNSSIFFQRKKKSYFFNANTVYDENGLIVSRSNTQKKNSIFFLTSINDKLYGLTKNTFPYIYDFQKNNYNYQHLKSNLFIQNFNTVDNQLWVTTSTGAYCFDENFNPLYNGFCFFEKTSISKVIKDREGNYWFSTLNKGLIFVPNLNIRLYNFDGASVTALEKDEENKRLLLGTDRNEILSFDEQKRIKKEYSGGIMHEVIFLKKDKVDIYAASYDFRLLNNQFKQKWKQTLSVKGYTEINDDFFAVVFSNGAILMPKGRSRSVPKWLHNKENKWTEDNAHYSLFEEESRGRAIVFSAPDTTLYIATTKGFFYFSPNGRGEIKWQNQTITSVSKIKVYDNKVYFSTFDLGLFCIDNHRVSNVLSMANGLQNNVVYHFEKNNNRIWTIGDGILQCYNENDKTFASYDFTDGLPKSEIKDIRINAQQVYLATTEGLVVLDENQANKNLTPPNIALTGVDVNGANINWYDGIELGVEDNDVNINFAILSYRAENNLTIEYAVNDEKWVAINSKIRTLPLTSLASGDYKIRIRARNEDGVLSEKPLTINFTIKTPFYRKWYVLLLTAVSALLLLYTYFRKRISLIEKNNALVKEKLNLEKAVQKSILASIKSQMNPHFLFNALNTIQTYIYTNDKENASVYLGKFSDLTRSILDMSNKESIPLSEEIRTLNLYLELEKTRFEDTLNYEIIIDSNIDKDWIHIPSMLVQPYVENAIKHGLFHKKDNRELMVNFKIENDFLVIIVDDNGIGRKRAEALKLLKNKQTHTSFAIDANQTRLDILNHGKKNPIVVKITDKKDDFDNPIGTNVCLSIPIGQQF